MNLAASVSTSSSTVNSPVASKRLEILKAPCRTDWSNSGKLDARNSSHDAATSSQGWQKDALLDGGTGNLVATEEDQEHLNYPADSVDTGKLVAQGYQGYQGYPGTPGFRKPKAMTKIHLHISPNFVHVEKILSIVRRTYSRSPTDQIEDFDENTAMWRISMSVTLRQDYSENLRSTKNQPLKSVKQLFQMIERLSTDQAEITGLTTIDWKQLMWKEATLLIDRDG